MMRRVIWIALIVGALIFSFQAGEFSTGDILGRRRQRERLSKEVDSLDRIVDSLRAVEKAIRTDPVVQERIAREEFGMVRSDNEILYRFVPRGGRKADSARNE